MVNHFTAAQGGEPLALCAQLALFLASLHSSQPRDNSYAFFVDLTLSLCFAPCSQVFSEYNVKTAEVKAGYDGRSRGYGIVSFESEEDAASGLQLGGYNLDGREMLVRFDRSSDE